MEHIIKSRKIIFMALAIGFGFTTQSTHAFSFDSLNRFPISYLKFLSFPQSDTLTNVGVASVVGFATFGAPALLAPIIAAKLTSVAWCGALAYLLFRSSDMNRKIYAIHGDTQKLRQDTNAIKKDTSNIRGTVAKLSDDFATHRDVVQTEFDNMRKQQQQNHAMSMKATQVVEKKLTEGLGEVKSEFSGVKAGVAQLDRNVVIMSGDLKNVNKALAEQKQETQVMHQDITEVKSAVKATGKSLGVAHSDITSLKQTAENNTQVLSELRTRTENIENIAGNVNDKLDHNFEEQQILKNRMHALKLEAKQILAMQDKSNKTQEQQANDIAAMQSDLGTIKDGVGHLVKSKFEKKQKQMATVVTSVLASVASQFSQKTVDDQTASGILQEDDDLD